MRRVVRYNDITSNIIYIRTMATFAIIEFGFIIIGLALSWAHVRWIRNRRQKKNEIDEINDRFNSIWDGSDEQELYAWYLVKNELHFGMKKPKEEVIDYINGRISQLNTFPMKSRTFVNEYGELNGTIVEKKDW